MNEELVSTLINDIKEEGVELLDTENINTVVNEYGETPQQQNNYTREELFDKFGTDNVDLINAGKEEENRVSLIEEKSIEE